ncbi:MAG: FxLYD domain-containing protein [Bacillota bacterium]
MKKLFLIIMALGFSFSLAACGGENLAGDTNTPSDQSEQEAPTESESSPDDNEAQSEPKLEIVKSTGGVWKDSIDTVWVHSAAIFENTGDVPIEIGETQMNFKGQDGSILGTATMVYSVPGIVAPGEQAYISETTILEGITDPREYKETTYNFSFDETDGNANLLEVSGVKGIPGKDDMSSPYRVTGLVKNTTDKLQDDIRISAALLAEDGTLLGVLNGSVDVGVNAGSEAGFELSYPEVPKDIASKVKTVEVKAYGWTW